MFDLGFIKDIRYLLRRLPAPDKRLNMLFSATLSQRVMELAYEHMNEPDLVRIVGDLHREFAGWRQHECARLLLALSRWLGLQKTLKGRDQECGRLAGPGLRLAGDIPLFKGDWQCTRLYWRTKFESRIADSSLNALVERK